MLHEQSVLVAIDKEKMQERQYEPILTAVAHTMGYVNVEKQCRIVSKSEYRAFLRDRFVLTKYKIDTLIDTYKMLGLLEEEKGNYLFFPVKRNFISLSFSTILFFLNHLSPLNFKIYCWLLNKYDLHEAYFKNSENYFFNIKELVEGIGYSYNNKNIRDRVKEGLVVLEKIGYIKYNHEYIGRPGHHGLYLELYKVYKYSNTQIKAHKELVQEWLDQGREISIGDALTVLNPETKSMLEILLNQNKIKGESQLLIEEVSNVEQDLKQKADMVKNLLEKGYSQTSIDPEYLEAYNKVY